jgi:branched-chain amino acid transport system ATP-binding protein
VTALAVEALSAGYGPIQVLRGVGLSVAEGEIVALLGANGAGKTTALRAISGVLRGTGAIRLGDARVERHSAAKRAALGLAHVPQGRGTFVDFTVEENLRLGAYTVRDPGRIADDVAHWFATFPRLGERRRQAAGSLSGGEQQMLAVARAMMTRPRVLMCDEPSLGLAPVVTAELFETLSRLAAEHGTAVLIVEQNADLTLAIARRAYVIENGAIVLEGAADELRRDKGIRRAYLGLDA